MMGGRVAEELIFSEISTGASNDIERASGLARRMVTEYGMSDKLGPLALGKKDELVFLGREINDQRNYSDEIAFEIDKEIRRLIDEATMSDDDSPRAHRKARHDLDVVDGPRDDHRRRTGRTLRYATTQTGVSSGLFPSPAGWSQDWRDPSTAASTRGVNRREARN
ncbi:MAG: hypothetical protein R2849_16720 [Thermomicrobiales bacterium]